MLPAGGKVLDQRLEPLLQIGISQFLSLGGTLKCAFADVLPERPVSFELAFIEELIGRALVGEQRLAAAVFDDHLILVTGEGGFKIEKVAALRFLGICNPADGEMFFASSILFGIFEPDLLEVDVDIDPQIDTP